MDKEYIEKLAKDPGFIPGIYNYCDRWCERCAFTSRCMTYALSEDQFDSPESKDLNNQLFWDKLGEVFAWTLQMVTEYAEEMGIDLSEARDEEAELKERRIDTEADEHPCATGAKEYADTVKAWFDSANKLFDNKADEFQKQIEINLPESDPAGDAHDLGDAMEVVRWYQHFIYVKLLRALRGMLRSGEDDFERDDSNGSAKVVLIAIDRSIAAWGRLLTHFDDREEELLAILVKLQRLSRAVESTFSGARAFVRSGLDQANQAS